MNARAVPEDVIILLAEDDDGHAELVEESLRDAGVRNALVRFHDGQETLDFFFPTGEGGRAYQHGCAYLLLLDIRMPKVDGTEVLARIKQTPHLCQLPVIMLTTTDDPREVEHCYRLGCSVYITKPLAFQAFSEALHRLGLFIPVIDVPKLD